MPKANIKKTILIVDDNEDIRILCERELSGQGYRTHSVASGLEALQFIDKNPKVDLVILDIKMPSLDGIEVLKELRAKSVNIPVILYSDYSSYRSSFLSWLGSAYLMKSSDLTELKEKVKELLNLSELQ